MKKNALFTASLLALVTVLSGCGGSDEEPALAPEPVDKATDSSTSVASQAPRSPRGNLIKRTGEPSLILLDEKSKDWALNFTVTDIQVDPLCTSPYAEASENGHLVALSIEATTAPEPEFTEVMYGPVSFNAHAWKVIASNGTTVNTIASTASGMCFPQSELLPSSIGAAEKVTGKVVLDVPDAKGTVVFRSNGGSGWEWEFGSE